MASRTPLMALVLALLVTAPGLAGCVNRAVAGEGDQVVVIRNKSGASARVEIAIAHSTTSPVPVAGGKDDVTGTMRVADGKAGAFFFRIPAEANMTMKVNQLSRTFTRADLATCTVFIWDFVVEGIRYAGCGPPKPGAS